MNYPILMMAVVGFAFAGCGPSYSSGSGSFGIPDGNGHCAGPYAASGGDPAGTWSVVSACIQGDPVALMNAHLKIAACPDIVRGYTVENASGMATLGAGAITSNDVAVMVRVDRVMTSACHVAVNATPINVQSDCDNYGSGLVTAVRGGLDSTCTYENDGCTCRSRYEYTLDGSTYQTAQNQLTVGADEFPYGVAGDVFTAQILAYETSGIQVRLQRVQR